MSTFEPFDKLARWSRNIVLTEKIDGTNSQVCISPPDDGAIDEADPTVIARHGGLGLVMRAGARNGWVQPEKSKDNHGFAAWVLEHADELFALGEGRHFGEFWGAGIQRRYGLTEKRFSLFNVGRWYDPKDCEGEVIGDRVAVPACCHVVPVLLEGPNDTAAIDAAMELLRSRGSYAAPGFMDPEGVVIFHTAANKAFKKTLKRDEMPKALAEKMGLAA